MKIKASLKYLHISPRKVRMITNLIKGMDVRKAKLQLQLGSRRAAKPLLKLLDSAVASAKHNFNLEEKNLYISKIVTNEGPTFKRFRARARGSAAPIMKRTTHVILELAEKIVTPPSQSKLGTGQVKVRKPRPSLKAPKVETTTAKVLKPRLTRKPQKKVFLGKARLKQIGKKIFRRKSI